MAARGKRKSSSSELLQKAAQELLQESSTPQTIIEQSTAETKSPQKGKRKAPAPPSRSTSTDEKTMSDKLDERVLQVNGDVVADLSVVDDQPIIKPVSLYFLVLTYLIMKFGKFYRIVRSYRL